MVIKQIFDKNELNILADKSAEFEQLHFAFGASYIERLKDKLADGYQFFAIENGEFVGYIAMTKSGTYLSNLSIVELFVDPAHQGKSYGTLLVQKAIAVAKDKACDSIIVQTEFENIPARKLYEKLGFKEVSNQDWPKGITSQLVL